MIKKVLLIIGLVILIPIIVLVIAFYSLSSTPKDAAITKEMHDAELQSIYGVGRVVANLMSTEWGVGMVHRTLMNPLKGSKMEGYYNEERFIESTEGHNIRVRIFKPLDASEKLPAMLYAHGGGYLTGVPEQAFPFYENLLTRRDLVIVAPAYRLSIDHPFPAGFNDCYETLIWMKEHADELGIYDDKFMIAGHSAGGGMTAALSLRARDTKKVNIAFQMPIYPMIDHRQITTSSQKTGAAVWDPVSNKLGWDQYLKGLEGDEITAYASPALADDFHGLPPTITFVGDLEPFLDETINYVEALKEAGVPTRFKLFKKAFHGFESIGSQSTLGKSGNDFQLKAFEEYFDQYAIMKDSIPQLMTEVK